jgi:hypothetical protein
MGSHDWSSKHCRCREAERKVIPFRKHQARRSLWVGIPGIELGIS